MITPLSFEEFEDKDRVIIITMMMMMMMMMMMIFSRDENSCCIWVQNPLSENIYHKFQSYLEKKSCGTGCGQRLPCIAPGTRRAAESGATHGGVWGHVATDRGHEAMGWQSSCFLPFAKNG